MRRLEKAEGRMWPADGMPVIANPKFMGKPVTCTPWPRLSSSGCGHGRANYVYMLTEVMLTCDLDPSASWELSHVRPKWTCPNPLRSTG